MVLGGRRQSREKFGVGVGVFDWGYGASPESERGGGEVLGGVAAVERQQAVARVPVVLGLDPGRLAPAVTLDREGLQNLLNHLTLDAGNKPGDGYLLSARVVTTASSWGVCKDPQRHRFVRNYKGAVGAVDLAPTKYVGVGDFPQLRVELAQARRESRGGPRSLS